MHDDLQNIIRAAHDGELPNDWRFGMAYNLCHALLDYSQPLACAVTLDDYREWVGDVVELQIDASTHALLVWLSDNVARCHFDEPEIWCDSADGSDIADLAQRRQRETIATMAHVILQGVADLVSA
jgi:hypothetical protein